MTKGFTLFIVFLIVGIIAAVLIVGVNQWGDFNTCLDHQLHYEKINGRPYCTGVRDGNTVIIPVEDLRD